MIETISNERGSSVVTQISLCCVLSELIIPSEILQELMIGIHQTIMKQLSVKADYSEAYGNIYYLAWNLADEQTKEKLEECCIQDVMFRWEILNAFI